MVKVNVYGPKSPVYCLAPSHMSIPVSSVLSVGHAKYVLSRVSLDL